MKLGTPCSDLRFARARMGAKHSPPWFFQRNPDSHAFRILRKNWISYFFSNNFRMSLRSQIFKMFTNFCCEYCNLKLSDARNPNMSSESPCGMIFAWEHQFPEFRLPWRCNFRFWLWDFFPGLKDLDTKFVPNFSFLLPLGGRLWHERNRINETGQKSMILVEIVTRHPGAWLFTFWPECGECFAPFGILCAFDVVWGLKVCGRAFGMGNSLFLNSEIPSVEL